MQAFDCERVTGASLRLRQGLRTGVISRLQVTSAEACKPRITVYNNRHGYPYS